MEEENTSAHGKHAERGILRPTLTALSRGKLERGKGVVGVDGIGQSANSSVGEFSEVLGQVDLEFSTEDDRLVVVRGAEELVSRGKVGSRDVGSERGNLADYAFRQVVHVGLYACSSSVEESITRNTKFEALETARGQDCSCVIRRLVDGSSG